MYTVEECRNGSYLRVSGHTDCFISDLKIELNDQNTSIQVSVAEDVATQLSASHSFSQLSLKQQNDALGLA